MGSVLSVRHSKGDGIPECGHLQPKEDIVIIQHALEIAVQLINFFCTICGAGQLGQW